MRYSISYFGAYYTGDDEGFNCHFYNSWDVARAEQLGLWGAGKRDVVLKDEDYDCSLSWNAQSNDWEWDC